MGPNAREITEQAHLQRGRGAEREGGRGVSLVPKHCLFNCRTTTSLWEVPSSKHLTTDLLNLPKVEVPRVSMG